MTRLVQCAKLGCEADGLDFAPYPGELGARIYNQVSKQAWTQWLAHQTMLINENRLSPIDPKARKYLREQMQAFLFGGRVDPVAGYLPPSD
ncbi:MAG: oxidative damage protection protein [Rhodanobacteraceae bacterium]|jgi:Fe-S cluster biosynthesis and repair protein YggX|nr:oxidative damage protection protein [Rhodanobacteraceae bacterium]MBK7044392.1 oxidative damage protection protein [Rhodanobacteraceae bacterium]MBP9155380.1 oxidative damage protection protein [Xanthomonadales bacterium]HQW82177.1 oxidative damage protection protein [Pseudomonadota bacterium]